MTQENAFLGALQGAASFRREGAELTLLDGRGEIVTRLAQTDWD